MSSLTSNIPSRMGERAGGETWRMLCVTLKRKVVVKSDALYGGSGVSVTPRFTHSSRHTFDLLQFIILVCPLDAHFHPGRQHRLRTSIRRSAYNVYVVSTSRKYQVKGSKPHILTHTRSFVTVSNHAISGWPRVCNVSSEDTGLKTSPAGRPAVFLAKSPSSTL